MARVWWWQGARVGVGPVVHVGSQLGFQIGSARVRFGANSYTIIEDAVDCPEWIVPFHVFKALADEYDFELVFAKNSYLFVEEHFRKPEFVELMRRVGALGDGNQDQSTLSADEWEVAYLYLTFVLRKRGQPDKTQEQNRRRDKGKLHIQKEDVMFIST